MKKENYISTNITESIFDAIRHINENGNEYWEARELQALLGQSKPLKPLTPKP